MNPFTALLRTRSVRYWRLHPAHGTGRPRGFHPRLEDLESRLAPAAPAGALPPPLGLAAQAAPLAPANFSANEVAQVPTVTVSNPDAFAAEDPTGTPGVPQTQDTATFRISRSGGNADAPLTVFYRLTGLAQNGVDYVTLPGSATIAAGLDSVDVVVTPFPRPPHQPVPLVDVHLTLTGNEGYGLGAEDNAVAVIFQNAHFPPQLPTVTVSNPDAFASEDANGPPGAPQTQDTATFRITRNGAGDTAPLTVFFALSGTAQNGVDYVTVAGSATIPAGQDFVDVVITPLTRPVRTPVPLASVTLTLTASENYLTGTQDNATVAIFEFATPQLPTVTVSAPDPTATEDPAGTPGVPETQDTGTFRITRSGGNTDAPLTVLYTLTGTAQNGVDYVTLAGSVTIPAGQDFVDLTVTPFPRPVRTPLAQADVVLTLTPSEGYLTGEANSATVVISELVQVTPPVVPPVTPPVTPPPVTPPPVVTPVVNNAALAIALTSGNRAPLSASTSEAPLQLFFAGLPLDPALRDRPGGLLPLGSHLDGTNLVGGTSSIGIISGKIFDDFNGTGLPDRLKPGCRG